LQKKVAAMQSAAADEQLNEGVDQLRAASSALATAVESFRAAAGTSVPEPAAQPAPAPDESAASPSEMFDLEAGIRWPSKLSADVRNTAPFWEQRPRDTRKGAASHLGDWKAKKPEKAPVPLHIVHITAEMAPIAKVGGLGDVVTGLSRACLMRGHHVVVVLPFYSSMPQDRIKDLTFDRDFHVPKGSRHDGRMEVQALSTSAFTGYIDGVPVVLLRPADHTQSSLFVGDQIYGGSYNEREAYLYFCRASLEYLAVAGQSPNVIHTHEWQAAAAAMLFWDLYSSAMPLARLALTLHNMDSTGECSQEEFAFTGVSGAQFATVDKALDERTIGHNPERLSLLQGGIVYSNQVTTVSPTYAADALGGGGGTLRGVLGRKDVRAKFRGILNGIDTKEWDPSCDELIPAPFTAHRPEGKALCKRYLQEGLGLKVDASAPLVACITRLVPQKGVHLIRHALFHTRDQGGQAVLLGSGHSDPDFRALAAGEFKDSRSVRILIMYNDALAHLIYAAADIMLVPSMFEPCGLTQLVAMRYGAVPVVRATGGLADTVFDVDSPPEGQTGNGFTFTGADEASEDAALDRALQLYRQDPKKWAALSRANMQLDVGWDKSAQEYISLYESMGKS